MFINDPMSKEELLYNFSIVETTLKNKGSIDPGFIDIFEDAINALPKGAQKTDVTKRFEHISDAIFSGLEASSKDDRPLIGSPTSLVSIAEDYTSGFVKQGLLLLDPYFMATRTKGDGHCFFRATAYGLLRFIEENSPEKVEHLLKTVYSSLNTIGSASLSKKFAPIAELAKSVSLKKRSALDIINAKEDSDLLVSFLRDLACEYNRKESTETFEAYTSFIDTNKEQYLSNMKNMQRAELGGQPELLALEKTLGIRFSILDTQAVGKKQQKPEDYLAAEGQGAHTTISLLYRPGHYDIAFRRDA
jgi:hypothetical protein